MRQLFFSLPIMALAACSDLGKKPDQSDTKDLLTNLGTESTYYYYIQEDKIYRGKCEEGQPLLRSHCVTDLESTNLTDFRDRFLVGLNQRAAEINSEIGDLDLQYQTQTETYNAAKSRIEAAADLLDSDTEALETKEERLTELNPIVEEFDARITAIEAMLRENPDDADLLAARLGLVNDRLPYAEEKSQLDTDVVNLAGSITGHNSEIETATAIRDEALAARNIVEDKSRSARAQLILALDQLDNFELLMEKVAQDGIQYRAMTGDSNFENARDFIEMFDRAFLGNGVDLPSSGGLFFDFEDGLPDAFEISSNSNSSFGWQVVDGKLKTQAGASYNNNLITAAKLRINASRRNELKLTFDASIATESGYDRLRINIVDSDNNVTTIKSYDGRISMNTSEINLDRYAGTEFDLVFQFTSDGSSVAAGVTLDNIGIQ